jgi:hypothetical protein
MFGCLSFSSVLTRQSARATIINENVGASTDSCEQQPCSHSLPLRGFKPFTISPHQPCLKSHHGQRMDLVLKHLLAAMSLLSLEKTHTKLLFQIHSLRNYVFPRDQRFARTGTGCNRHRCISSAESAWAGTQPSQVPASLFKSFARQARRCIVHSLTSACHCTAAMRQAAATTAATDSRNQMMPRSKCRYLLALILGFF